MSKKKTGAEMREIAERIKEMIKYLDKDDSEDCEYWDEDCDCCDGDCEEEDENERNEDENEYYRHNECEDHDGDCEDCSYYNEDDCCCELDDENETEDEEEDEEENTQTEELSKFIMSVNTVLGGNMGLLIFDKSNKKDMEKIAAIFEEYAKRLS